MDLEKELEDLPPVVRKRAKELKTGMVLARPVHSSNGSRLKQAGETLNSEDIERLQRWKTDMIHIFDPDASSSEPSPFSPAS